MASLAAYFGRTVDLLAFQGQSPQGETLLTPALLRPGEGGEICTGIVKLAQRWLLEFLTEGGSMPYLPRRGCPFMALLRTGQLRTTVDIEQAFFLSARQVQANLQLEETRSTPDDEAYRSVDLPGVLIAGDTIALRIVLTSRAGDRRSVILPVQVRTG